MDSNSRFFARVLSVVKSTPGVRVCLHENGQSLIEYQLLVGLVAVVCVAGITLFGSQVGALFNTITGAI